MLMAGTRDGALYLEPEKERAISLLPSLGERIQNSQLIVETLRDGANNRRNSKTQQYQRYKGHMPLLSAYKLKHWALTCH